MSNVSSLYRHANLASIADRINTNTITVQDYSMVSETVAKVVLARTGRFADRTESFAEISKLFDGLASPIEASFRDIHTAGNLIVSVGFVKANREVREFDAETASGPQGKFKTMASNLLMDKTDQTLWEVRSGSTGQFLVKQGNEDLSELVHLARASKGTLPTLAQVASVPAEVREFAAYVDLGTQEVMHGYVVEASGAGKVKVLSFEGDGEEQEIDDNQLVEVVNLDGADEQAAGVKMAREVASDRGALVSYYTKLFGSYAPEYLKKVIEIIDSHSFA